MFILFKHGLVLLILIKNGIMILVQIKNVKNLVNLIQDVLLVHFKLNNP